MSLLYIECNAGIAGDMLCGALLDLLPKDKAAKAVRLMNELPLPDVHVEVERAETCGVTGAHVHVLVRGEEEHSHDHHGEHGHHHHGEGDHGHHAEHDHEYAHHADHHHAHGHEHHHGHHEHRSYMNVAETIDAFTALPEAVRRNAQAVYRLIAEAEATVHGTTMEDIHFHEVGTLDAIADVTFACLLMDMIAPEHIMASPVRTGYGEVRCAHGVLPVPAPATALLLEGIPNYAGEIEGEFCTPTGAALLKHFATSFGQRPVMSTMATGYGIGTKQFPIANCVRTFLGESTGTASGASTTEALASDEGIVEACCNIDDMTAEDIAFACEQLMDAGALDVFTIPIGMKKGRPGTLVCALCEAAAVTTMEDVLFRHTTTLGVRHRFWERTTLQREIIEVDTPLGPVRQKIARDAGGTIIRRKWEHDDLVRLARKHDLSIDEVRKKLT